jgi:hypothetical protein
LASVFFIAGKILIKRGCPLINMPHTGVVSTDQSGVVWSAADGFRRILATALSDSRTNRARPRDGAPAVHATRRGRVFCTSTMRPCLPTYQFHANRLRIAGSLAAKLKSMARLSSIAAESCDYQCNKFTLENKLPLDIVRKLDFVVRKHLLEAIDAN